MDAGLRDPLPSRHFEMVLHTATILEVRLNHRHLCLGSRLTIWFLTGLIPYGNPFNHYSVSFRPDCPSLWPLLSVAVGRSQ